MFRMYIYGFEHYLPVRILLIVLAVCVLFLQVPIWYRMFFSPGR